MTETTAARGNAWQRFWNRGGWWKALIAAVAYLALYQGFSILVVGPVWGGEVEADIFSTPQSVFFGLFLPLLFGTVVLLVFVGSLDWFGPLFRRQPVRGRWWMWIAVVLVLLPIGLRLVGIDYASYGLPVVALTFATGLLIGATEEVLTRGIAVKLLRDAGHREVVVAVISSALFSLLHAVNILLGQPVLTVLLTMAFTFGFGMMMYLVLRATGSLIWPILLHGLTDPTTFLASGGIDVAHGPTDPFLTLAGPFNLVFVAAGLLALFFIRGRVGNVVNPQTAGRRMPQAGASTGRTLMSDDSTAGPSAYPDQRSPYDAAADAAAEPANDDRVFTPDDGEDAGPDDTDGLDQSPSLRR